MITTDTTLQADLAGCTGDGLVIGADGITLNLGGHTIAGTAGAVAGIRVEGRGGDPGRNQAVRNGRYGIEAEVAVSDGGGNVAYGNHADVQCTGVACQTRS